MSPDKALDKVVARSSSAKNNRLSMAMACKTEKEYGKGELHFVLRIGDSCGGACGRFSIWSGRSETVEMKKALIC